MSKINAIQAAALNATSSTASNTKEKAIAVKKETVAKKKTPAKAAKPEVSKAPAKTAATKPVAKTESTKAKPVTAKPAAKPAATQAATAAKVAKPAAVKPVKEKAPKLKMERDSFTMPKTEYAQLYVLKERLIKLGQASKKSELLRAGIMQLTAMTDAALKAAMAKVPAIKTGRPKKK